MTVELLQFLPLFPSTFMLARALRRTLLLGVLLAIGIITSGQTYAATGDITSEDTLPTQVVPTGFGTIIVEQLSSNGIMGTWTLLQPNNVKSSGADKTKAMDSMAAGSYTIIIEPPDGAVASINLYNHGVQLKSLERPQATFTVFNGDDYKIVVSYTFTRVGIVSVTSDPQGVTFRLTGPNGMNVTGTTPMSYENVAEGQYKLQYDTFQNCTTPPPKASQLEKNKRISFDITFSCAAADNLRNRKEREDIPFVTQTIDGKEITFRDVPQTAWFAKDVSYAARGGILGGYKDGSGSLTGEFGPANNVSVAELAKIAHKVAGTTEMGFGPEPFNKAAYNQWFTNYFISAEERGWTIFTDGTINPLRPATRSEVLVTLMQALNLQITWQKGDVFTDVRARTPYAAAIEAAAKLKIVEGRKDEAGTLTGAFGPSDPVTRAEIAKIVNTALKAAGKALVTESSD